MIEIWVCVVCVIVGMIVAGSLTMIFTALCSANKIKELSIQLNAMTDVYYAGLRYVSSFMSEKELKTHMLNVLKTEFNSAGVPMPDNVFEKHIDKIYEEMKSDVYDKKEE